MSVSQSPAFSSVISSPRSKIACDTSQLKQTNCGCFDRQKHRLSLTSFHPRGQQLCQFIGTYERFYIGAMFNYLRDCLWLARKTIGIVTQQCPYPWKQWKCRLKGTNERRDFEWCMSTVYIKEMFNSQRTGLGYQHDRRLRTPMWRFFMHDGTTLKRVCRGSGFSLQ